MRIDSETKSVLWSIGCFLAVVFITIGYLLHPTITKIQDTDPYKRGYTDCLENWQKTYEQQGVDFAVLTCNSLADNTNIDRIQCITLQKELKDLKGLN